MILRLAHEVYHVPWYVVGEWFTSRELTEEIAFAVAENEERRVDYMSHDELIKEYQLRQHKLKLDGLDDGDDYMLDYIKRAIVRRGAAKIEDVEGTADDDEPPIDDDG